MPLLGFYIFAFLTLPFIGLAVDINAVVAQKGAILFSIFLGGIALLLVTSVAFTRSLALVTPNWPVEFFTVKQAIAVIVGFAGLGFYQLLVNNASIQSFVLGVGPQTSFTFKIDAAIAEESLFGAITVLVFLAVRLRFNRLSAGIIAALSAAIAFMYFHIYAYGTNPSALVFVFGARIILVTVLLATLVYSKDRSSASLVAPTLLHVVWNGVS